MQILLDFIPIALFFLFFKLFDIYAATAAAIVATILQISFIYFKNKKIEKTPLITLIIILIFGGATLLLHNELFIKWKPTVLYWIICSIILFAKIIKKTPISAKVMADKISLTDKKWKIVDNYTFMFFSFMGALNLYVAYNFDTNTWVNFKLFGALALTMIFCLALSCYMAKNAESIDS